jgi:mRNA-degrading endonuclease RelE of RelBE toxin-antitoxin system
MNSIEIVYSKQARLFIEKNAHLLSFHQANTLLVKALRKLLKEEDVNSNVIAMQGNKGLYRIRKGNLRIIFRYENGEILIVYVERIDVRGSVYS